MFGELIKVISWKFLESCIYLFGKWKNPKMKFMSISNIDLLQKMWNRFYIGCFIVASINIYLYYCVYFLIPIRLGHVWKAWKYSCIITSIVHLFLSVYL